MEATPPSGDLPSARNTRKQGTFSSVLDLLKQTFQQAFADVRRGYFADAVLTVIEAVSGFLPRLLRHPAVLAVLLFSAAVPALPLFQPEEPETAQKTPELGSASSFRRICFFRAEIRGAVP